MEIFGFYRIDSTFHFKKDLGLVNVGNYATDLHQFKG
jgi:hypothetical protein